MEERSKTNKEIYDQKYPLEVAVENPMLCAEAIGFLKALKEYFPSEQKWVEAEMSGLKLAVLFHSLQGGTNMWYEFNTGMYDNLTEVMKIIDDALCYGFEFKVENHKLYFRELA